jgi:hypothetical protein
LAGDGRARGRLSSDPSPLELLHPDGFARASSDVVVVEDSGPRSAELLREGLGPDGLACLRLPWHERRELARAAGLELGPAIFETGSLLLPVERDALRWARRSRAASRRRRVAALAPVRVLDRLAPAALARKPRARRPGAWLRAKGNGTAVVASRRAAFLVDGRGLQLVAKVGARLSARRELAEGRALAELGPAAQAAGADVPALVEQGELGDRHLLVMTGVDGRPAFALLAERPGRLTGLVERIATWLLRWNVATAVETSFSRELLEREVLVPARALGLPEQYLSALERSGHAVGGRHMKLVAAHNDLTTANVLLGRGRRLGVIDWETATAQTLPLGDLVYVLADAEAAKHGFADRPAAFRSSFDGPPGALERRLTDALGLDSRIADLCFHACWLRHAANEALRPESETRPFLEIVRTIAERRIRMGG